MVQILISSFIQRIQSIIIKCYWQLSPNYSAIFHLYVYNMHNS